MDQSYYSRTGATHVDGTRIFASEKDIKAEAEVAAVLAKAWKCEVRRFGALSPVDWYCTRDGRITGVAELKNRSKASTEYTTVFLNVRKWLALQLVSAGMGVPAVYVVRFADGLFWCRLHDIDPRQMQMGGCSRRVKADNDFEPVINVDMKAMKLIQQVSECQ